MVLMAHGRAVSKELSAIADQFILLPLTEKVKSYLWKSFAFFVFDGAGMYFSCFAKKSTKRRRPRGAEFLAPARKAAPLETPGAHRHNYGTSCTTILSVKKCSDFFFFFLHRATSAERRERSRRFSYSHNKRTSFAHEDVPQFLRCAPGDSKGGGSGAGATSLSAPLAAFFGYFLGGARK